MLEDSRQAIHRQDFDAYPRSLVAYHSSLLPRQQEGEGYFSCAEYQWDISIAKVPNVVVLQRISVVGKEFLLLTVFRVTLAPFRLGDRG